MSDYLTDAENDIKTYFKTHDIPTYFYQCFFGELVKVFGTKFLIPDKAYLSYYEHDNEDNYSYKEQIGFFLTCQGGTSGWNLAFEEACEQCDMMDMYIDYRHFCWVRSDILDGYIADKMLDVLFDGVGHNDYYRFKMQKDDTK